MANELQRLVSNASERCGSSCTTDHFPAIPSWHTCGLALNAPPQAGRIVPATSPRGLHYVTAISSRPQDSPKRPRSRSSEQPAVAQRLPCWRRPAARRANLACSRCSSTEESTSTFALSCTTATHKRLCQHMMNTQGCPSGGPPGHERTCVASKDALLYRARQVQVTHLAIR